MKGHAQVVAAVFLYLAVGAAMAAEPLPGTGKAAGDVGPARASGIVVRGNDRLSGSAVATAEQLPGGMVSLNLIEVPIPVAAKAVLTDTLGWGYTLDAETHGTLTLQTGGPVTRAALLTLFEGALSSRGLVLRRRGRTAQILPAGADTLQPVRGAGAEAGAVVVPLRWISAAEMQAILGAVAPRDVVLRADRARNLLILNGNAGQIRVRRETIAVFDVDWMRGMSTAMLPVRSANPRAIARDLTQIFGGEAAGTGDVIRFVPNEALGAVLVVSSRAAYLDRARVWLTELETLGADRERQLFVYRIQNRSAKELAAVLQNVVAAETGSPVNASAVGGYGSGSGGGLDASGAGFGPGTGFGASQGSDFGGGSGTAQRVGLGGAGGPSGDLGAGGGYAGGGTVGATAQAPTGRNPATARGMRAGAAASSASSPTRPTTASSSRPPATSTTRS